MNFSNALRDRVTDAMARWAVPGVTVGTLSTERVETWAFGVVALDTQFPVRTDTLFQIGSISKPFTATLLMTLVERGELGLDEPVTTYVPDLILADPEAPDKITPRHLLTHQAGFWGDWFADFGLGDTAIERFVAQYGRLPQTFEPGTHWAYNNCGYILAGLIAARITGKTFEQALYDLVIRPLGLEHTVLSAAEAIAYPVAVGHTVDPHTGEARIARSFLRPRARNAAGGVLASIDDVLRFAELHLRPDGSVLSPQAVARMRESQVDTFEAGASWGLGFKIEQYEGGTVVGHGGATNGFRALLQMVPEQEFAVAILTNGDNGSQLAGEIADWILAERLGIRPVEHPTVPLDSAELERLTGVYTQPYGRIEIRSQAGELEGRQTTFSPYSEVEGEVTGKWFRLRTIGDGRAIVEDGELQGNQIKFWDAEDGGIRFLQAGGRLYFPDAWPFTMGDEA